LEVREVELTHLEGRGMHIVSSSGEGDHASKTSRFYITFDNAKDACHILEGDRVHATLDNKPLDQLVTLGGVVSSGPYEGHECEGGAAWDHLVTLSENAGPSVFAVSDGEVRYEMVVDRFRVPRRISFPGDNILSPGKVVTLKYTPKEDSQWGADWDVKAYFYDRNEMDWCEKGPCSYWPEPVDVTLAADGTVTFTVPNEAIRPDGEPVKPGWEIDGRLYLVGTANGTSTVLACVGPDICIFGLYVNVSAPAVLTH
jgi:hypothetical protein